MFNLIWNDGSAANVPAVQPAINWLPCDTTTRAALPFRYRKAFDRSRNWAFQYQCLGGPLVSIYRTLIMRSGKIVTIYAHEQKES